MLHGTYAIMQNYGRLYPFLLAQEWGSLIDVTQ